RRAPRYAMPSPLARLDGDSTRLDRGSLRHTAPSTSRPKAAYAVPYGRGSTRGSLTATPWAMTGRGAGFDPHPAISSAITAAPATARSSFLMRIGRIARRSGGIEMITLVIDLLRRGRRLPGRAPIALGVADLPAARRRTIAVLGHEQTGIPPEAVELLDVAVEIPMVGSGASLNVAVAGSLVLYRLAGLI